MGDIGFEEQLEQERLAREQEEARLLDTHPKTRTDPDGTVFEWDVEKKAWFPKIDTDFIAQYQMNYGVQTETTEGSGDAPQPAAPTSSDYENYLKYYHEAGQDRMLGRSKKDVVKEDTHDEMVEKLQQLESSIQQGGDSNGQSGESDDKTIMENYTEEEKKQYNDYWNYYYGTQDHDYYADCMNQSYATEQQVLQGEGQTGQGQRSGNGDQITGKENQTEEGTKGDKKKGKKRKGAAQQERPEGWFQVEETHNTNVYVSGLPLDVTDDEFKELMNKCGLIMYDPRTRKPKLKLYRDENGEPKGDGRCCYIKIESVELAMKIIDGSDVRGHKVKVEQASFHMKGDYDPSKKKKKLTNKEKRKFKEKQAKLFDWRPERPQGGRLKHEKIVILKNLFDPAAFELNPALINTVREDVRSECSNYGEVKKVIVYDRHPDGVVSVAYKEAEEADLCVSSLHQRWFAKRRILAATWDGNTKYEVQETEQQREERLKKWENFLETDDKVSDKTDTKDEKDSKIDSQMKEESENRSIDVAADKIAEKSDISESDSNTDSKTESDKSGKVDVEMKNAITEAKSDVSESDSNTGSKTESDKSGKDDVEMKNAITEAGTEPIQSSDKSNEMEMEESNREMGRSNAPENEESNNVLDES